MCQHIYICMYANSASCGKIATASVLSRLFGGGGGGGGAAPPYCPNTPLYQCFRVCCTPNMMACKADLYSIVITKQLYTCKYTAISSTIVMLVEDRGWIKD